MNIDNNIKLPDDYLKSIITYVCDTITLKNKLIVIDGINYMCLPEYYKIYILKFAFMKFYNKKIKGFSNELIYESFQKNPDILFSLLEMFIYLNTKNDKYSVNHFTMLLNIKSKNSILFDNCDYMNLMDKISNSEMRKKNNLKKLLTKCECDDELYNIKNNNDNISLHKEETRINYYK